VFKIEDTYNQVWVHAGLQYLQKSRAKNICFLFLISAIKAHLRFVGVTLGHVLGLNLNVANNQMAKAMH
jgi:hypothetical protein